MKKHLPRWREEQKERKANKTRRFAFSCLFLILLILLGGLGYKIYGSISKSIWDGKNQINLAFDAQPVAIASFNPQENSANILIIPNGTLVEAAWGYGPYRAESLFGLGELDGRGGEVLTTSLQEYLGIPIDAYASMQSAKCKPSSRAQVEGVQSAKEAKDSILGVFLSFLKNGGKTNLTKWDLFRLWWKINNIPEDKIKIFDLDPQLLEQIISGFAIDEKIKEEDLAIAVLNATDQPGLATKGSRLARNIGGRVIGIGELENGEWKMENGKCQIRSKKIYKNSYTVKKLSKIFNCDWGGENLEGQRAEVVLIIGR